MQIRYLDLMRVASIFYIVFFWHVNNYAGNIFINNITKMFVFSALSCFVFLSGFLLSRNYDLKKIKDIKVFLKKRFIKLYPLYLFSLLLFALSFSKKSGFSLKIDENILSQILLINMFLDKSVLTLWFMGMIFNYYFLASLLLYNYSIKKLIWSFLVVLSLLVVTFYFTKLIDKRIILYLPCFFLGIACAKEKVLYSYLFSNIKVNLFLSAVFGINLLIIYKGYLNLNIFLFFTGFIFIIPMSSFFKYLESRISFKMIKILSYSSFCMYLYHRFFYSVLTKLLNNYISEIKFLLLIIIGCPIIVIFSFYIQLSYDFILKILSKYYYNRVYIK